MQAVSEERLEEIELEWRRENHPCLRRRDKRTRTKAFLAGARAVLEELNIAGTVIITPELLRDGVGWATAVATRLKETLPDGSVLVRVKGDLCKS